MALITLIPILGYTLAIHIWGRRTISSSVLFSICGIITLLYLAGLIELLQGAAWFIFYLGCAIFPYIIYHEREKSVHTLLSVPVILFVVAAICHFLIFKEALYYYWDTFGYWGRASSELIRSHTYSQFHYNRPGSAVWHYFVTLHAGFSEGNTIFGHFLILFGATLPIYEKLSWKDFHWISCILILQLTLFALLSHGFGVIYTGHLVSVIFAGTVLSIVSQTHTAKDLYWYILPLCALFLVKYIGFAFSMAFLGLAALLLISEKTQEQGWRWRLVKSNRSYFVAIVATTVIILIVFFSWPAKRSFMSDGGVGFGNKYAFLAERTLSNKSGLDSSGVETVTRNFIDAVVGMQLGNAYHTLGAKDMEFKRKGVHERIAPWRLSALGYWFFIIAIVSIAAATYRNHTLRKRSLLTGGYIVLICLIYMCLFYLTYLYQRQPSHALILHSYVRWTHIAAFPMVLISLALLLPSFSRYRVPRLFTKVSENLPHGKDDEGTPLVILIIIAATLIIVENPYYRVLYQPSPPFTSIGNQQPFRSAVSDVVEEIKSIVDVESKIYVATKFSISSGPYPIHLGYFLLPARVSVVRLSSWENVSDEDLLEKMVKYQYLWFPLIDSVSELRSRVSSILGIPDEQLGSFYKVEKRDGGVHFSNIPLRKKFMARFNEKGF